MRLLGLTVSVMLVASFAFTSLAQAPEPKRPPASQSGNTTLPPSESSSPKPGWKEGDDCLRDNLTAEAIEKALQQTPTGPKLLSATYFLPAGSSAETVLDEPFKEGTHYFGYIQDLDRRYERLRRIAAGGVPDQHSLVKNRTAEKGRTLLTFSIPDGFGRAWRGSTLYVYTCTSSGSPKSVSQLATRASSSFYSWLVVSLTTFLVYVAAALASKVADSGSVAWYRYFDPVYMTAGTDGKGSLSKLQILFFSIIVFFLLSYIVARTGVLLDLPTSILLLLGIAVVGSSAATLSDVPRNQIDFENQAWLIRKGWLTSDGWPAFNKAKWYDLVTTEGEFDVYRYQTCIFSLIVGGALVAAGITELASFTIPETLLGILGLSQVTYVGGKLVNQTSIGKLNTAIKESRDLENKFVQAALTTPDPHPSTLGDELTMARRRAGEVLYINYKDKAESARLLFQLITGRKVSEKLTEPSVAGVALQAAPTEPSKKQE